MHLFRTSTEDLRTVARSFVRGTRRAAYTLVGFMLVAVGLTGLLLPVLPGWILIIGGFAVLSREYAWAHSGLSLARRHASRGGTRLRSFARRRASRTGHAGVPAADVVIDLRKKQHHGTDSTRYTEAPRRASNLG